MRLGQATPPLPARALILAAGRGERMRPLTDHCPKPLLSVQGKPLLQWWIEALRRGGVAQIVVNTAWLGEQIEAHCQGLADGPPIRCSAEGRDFGYALETAGGIVRALPLLAPAPNDVFWVLAGDIFAPEFAITPQGRSALRKAAGWRTCGWCPTRRTTRAATSPSAPTARR